MWAQYSGEVSGFDFPNARRGTFLAYVVEEGSFRTVYLHPSSGRVMGEVPRDPARCQTPPMTRALGAALSC